jgi:hypothetical protein
MNLEFASGWEIEEVTAEDIYAEDFDGEEYVILHAEDLTYIQCARSNEQECTYFLEYQDGSLERHYRVGDGLVPLDRVLDAFRKYLNGDQSWRFDFTWRPMTLDELNPSPPEDDSEPRRRVLPQKRFGRRPPPGRRMPRRRSN